MRGYNFTERVRKILALAQAEAGRFGHLYVTPEHILLGLVRESQGVASVVLVNLHVDLDAVQQRLEEQIPPGTADGALLPELAYTLSAKRVLELAIAEARTFKHSYVGTEHLLLALLRDEGGVPAQILAAYGVGADNAGAETRRLLGAEPERPGR